MTDAGIPMGLKPCPFCGEQPKWRGTRSDYVRGIYRLQCLGETHLIQSYGPDEARCIAAWNTRAIADTPPPAAAGDRSLAEARDWDAVIAELYQWTGSDWLSGTGAGHDERRFEHYSWLCRLAGYLMAGKEACLKALRTPEPNSGGEASDA